MSKENEIESIGKVLDELYHIPEKDAVSAMESFEKDPENTASQMAVIEEWFDDNNIDYKPCENKKTGELDAIHITFESDADASLSIGKEGYTQLAARLGVPSEKIGEVSAAIANVINVYQKNDEARAVYETLNKTDFNDSNVIDAKANTINAYGVSGVENFDPGLEFNPSFSNVLKSAKSIHTQNNLTNTTEDFGVDNEAQLHSDVKMAIAIIAHRSISSLVDRISHRKQATARMVVMKNSWCEGYSNRASNAKTVAEREGNHRFNLIDLDRDPSSIDVQLVKLDLLKTNSDKADEYLAADNEILFGKKVPLMDLTLVENDIINSKRNFTDILQDTVKYDTVTFSITTPDKTEIFCKRLSGYGSGQFVPTTNMKKASHRRAFIEETFVITKKSDTKSGAKNTILSSLGDNIALSIECNMSGSVDIATSYANNTCGLSLKAITQGTDEKVSDDVEKKVAAFKIEPISYSLDARYSELNMRQCDTAIRMKQKSYSYVIPASRNFIVELPANTQKLDYDAASQANACIKTASAVISKGQDWKAFNLMCNRAKDIFNTVNEYKALGTNLPADERINAKYPTGNIINPYVRIGSIDFGKCTENLSNGANGINEIRSLDTVRKPVNVRAFFRQALLAEISQCHSESLYDNYVRVPQYTAITGNFIMDHLFSSNFQYEHNGNGTGKPASTVYADYTVTLDNDTKVNVISLPWNQLNDRIFIIPFIPQDKESLLNFFTNYDRGHFVGQYSITQDSIYYKRLFINANEAPIFTAPICFDISIHNLDKVTGPLLSLDDSVENGEVGLI